MCSLVINLCSGELERTKLFASIISFTKILDFSKLLDNGYSMRD